MHLRCVEAAAAAGLLCRAADVDVAGQAACENCLLQVGAGDVECVVWEAVVVARNGEHGHARESLLDLSHDHGNGVRDVLECSGVVPREVAGLMGAVGYANDHRCTTTLCFAVLRPMSRFTHHDDEFWLRNFSGVRESRLHELQRGVALPLPIPVARGFAFAGGDELLVHLCLRPEHAGPQWDVASDEWV